MHQFRGFFDDAEGRILLVDESSLNDVLAMPSDSGVGGVIVLLNDSASTNQDARSWNPSGSGRMWEELRAPLQAVSKADAFRLASLAQQNHLKVASISFSQRYTQI